MLVVVSEETTGIVTPLDSNGDVDYFQAWDDLISADVTPENNAVVKMMEALGPEVEGPLPDQFFEQLGIERPPEQRKNKGFAPRSLAKGDDSDVN